MKVMATIAATPTSARMSAYSANPCPAWPPRPSRRIKRLTSRAPIKQISATAPHRRRRPTLAQAACARYRKAVLSAVGARRCALSPLAVYLVGDDREDVVDLGAEEAQRHE